VTAQLPLALRYAADHRLDTFVAAPAGAIAQLRALATAGGGFAFLTGAPGTGKTHLAVAVCAEAESRDRSSAYVPMALAVGRVRDALGALHDRDVVALDDIDAVAGSDDDELALFEFHNRAGDAGRAVVYTAAGAPGMLSLRLPDLRSRLAQAARVPLSPLDDDGRREVLRLRAEGRGLQIDAAAIDWLLRRVDRDLASLAGLLDGLDKAALAAQRRVTVPFLREWMDHARQAAGEHADGTAD